MRFSSIHHGISLFGHDRDFPIGFVKRVDSDDRIEITDHLIAFGNGLKIVWIGCNGRIRQGDVFDELIGFADFALDFRVDAFFYAFKLFCCGIETVDQCLRFSQQGFTCGQRIRVGAQFIPGQEEIIQ